MKRCTWAGKNPLMIAYHDTEWGVPVHDDRLHFEFLTLEAAQAGLSWLTSLKKRENYRKAFAQFDPSHVACFSDKDVQALLQNPGIVRNRLKIQSTIRNAIAFLNIQAQYGSFDTFIWQFTDGKPVVNQWKHLSEIPTQTPVSRAVSRTLKKCGFSFVGPTICYAYMQAIGMVNDHETGCFRHAAIAC